MIRVLWVLAGFAALVAVPSACSKFSASSSDEPADAGVDVATAAEGSAPTLEHRVYVFGGVTSGTAPITSAYVSVVSANGDLGNWTKLPPLDESRYAAVWAQVGDTLVAVSGTVQQSPFSRSGERTTLPHAAEPATAWTTTTPMATGRDHAAAMVRGNSLYVSGGKNAAGAVPNVERYDTTHDSWVGAGPMPVGVVGHATLVRKDAAYVVGGDRLGTSGPTTSISKASFADDGSLLAFMPGGALQAPLAYHSVAVVEPWLFTIGGATATSAVPAVSRGTFDAAGSVSAWESKASLPLPGTQAGLADACTVVLDRTIYVIGGRDGVAAPSSKPDVYVGRVDDVGVVTWTKGPLLPEARYALGCAISPSSAP
ncbi:MAG: nanM [Myxococcaceae bacterium]|jgi:hypothetical protein|nr:nanM [Myxococcaceae bacterium]MEA2747571.1 hypothetical protein [Myxococcales bacterium]